MFTTFRNPQPFHITLTVGFIYVQLYNRNMAMKPSEVQIAESRPVEVREWGTGNVFIESGNKGGYIIDESESTVDLEEYR